MNSSKALLAAGVVVLALAAAGFAVFGPGDGGPDGRADPDDAAQVRLGARVYAEYCAECHGRDLEGQPDWRQPLPEGGLPAPPHDETGHTWHHPDAQLFAYTKLGGAALAPTDFKSRMPGFADRLSDDEIWAVLAYIKSRWPEDIRARQAARSARR